MTQEEVNNKTEGWEQITLVNKRVQIKGETYFEKWFEDGTLYSRIKWKK